MNIELQLIAGGTRRILVYVPYWIVNYSDLHVLVRSAGRNHFTDNFSGKIVAGQIEAITVLRRLRIRNKLNARLRSHPGDRALKHAISMMIT